METEMAKKEKAHTKAGMQPKDSPTRPAVFINCTLEERNEIHEAAEAEGMRSVSTWARSVLLVAARKIKKGNR